MQDRIDKILGQWKRERPDLDTRPMGVIGRIQRATAALRPLLDETHEASGLQSEAFDVLASLRRSGTPHQLSPTELYREMMLTSGAMTSRTSTGSKKPAWRRATRRSGRSSRYASAPYAER